MVLVSGPALAVLHPRDAIRLVVYNVRREWAFQGRRSFARHPLLIGDPQKGFRVSRLGLRSRASCIISGEHSVQSVLEYNQQVVGSSPAAPTRSPNPTDRIASWDLSAKPGCFVSLSFTLRLGKSNQ